VLRAADFDFVSSEGTARTKVVDEVLSRPGRYQVHPERPEVSFKCVYAVAGEEKPAPPVRFYIVRRNEHEEAFQLHTIARHVARIEAVLGKGGAEAEKLLHHSTLGRYVRRSAQTRDKDGKPAGPPILDREAVERARRRAGKSVIATDKLDANPVTEDALYRRISDLERVFRELKSTIEVGPIRHRRAERIRAHVMIAVIARNLGAWLSRKSGLTIEALRRLFANCRVQEVDLGGRRYWERVELERAQEEVIAKMGYEVPPKRFTTQFPASGHQTPVP